MVANLVLRNLEFMAISFHPARSHVSMQKVSQLRSAVHGTLKEHKAKATKVYLSQTGINTL